MPEGPELYLTNRFINKVCKGRQFGKIMKSDVSKNPPVQPPSEVYTITAYSRGKEIKLTLTESCCTNDKAEAHSSELRKAKVLDILFTFGMTGKFVFVEAASELEKHAHLNFFTSDSKKKMVLSFVDYRRFGKWVPGADFSFKNRGPCVLQEYSMFRENIYQNLKDRVFDKPICEVLLDQKYFNGIGNYLRAEILHRARIPPFVSARSVLEPLVGIGSNIKAENPDVLELCHLLPQEVFQLGGSWYDGNDWEDNSNAFTTWLQCYFKDGMKTAVDHSKRTIWYSGPLGPMAPKDSKVRGQKRHKSKKKAVESARDDVSIETTGSERKLETEMKPSKRVKNSIERPGQEAESSKTGKIVENAIKLEQQDKNQGQRVKKIKELKQKEEKHSRIKTRAQTRMVEQGQQCRTRTEVKERQLNYDKK